jgi:probable dihydroxyacetone kinase regulator
MPTSEITKRALASSMKDLMENTPFAKISVGEICKKCGISRKTFYYHFKDKYELVNLIFSTELLSYIDIKQHTGGDSLFLDVCYHFYDNIKFYSNAFSVEGQNSFKDFFSETIESLVTEYLKDSMEDDEFCRFCCKFIANSLQVSIAEWLKGGAQIPPKKFASFLERSFKYVFNNPLK